MRQRTGLDEATTEVVARMVAKTRVGHWRYLRSARQQWKAVEGRTGATDCSESGGPNALEVPVNNGRPSNGERGPLIVANQAVPMLSKCPSNLVSRQGFEPWTP